MLVDEGNGFVEVMGVKCYLPPMPDEHDIRGYGMPKSKQVWQRTKWPLITGRDVDWVIGQRKKPDDKVTWQEARVQELAIQTGLDFTDFNANGTPRAIKGFDPDPNYLIEKLHQFRIQEFERCCPYRFDTEGNPLNTGLWFMNNGKPTYITPFHYFYLQWWYLNTGYPYYRDTDRKKFYYWQTAFESDVCYGITEAAKRGEGKTFRATSIAYLVTIYGKNTESAIQSKTDVDASDNVFAKKLAFPYKHLPDFFKPMNKHGTNPTSGMFFELSSKRGRSSLGHNEEQLDALNSTITFGNSLSSAYDGDNITGVFIRDEEGKTVTCDVQDRHSVTKNCVYRDGVIYGKIYSSTTVEEAQKGGSNYQKIWKGSDPKNTDTVTGETISGLWKLFIPAYESEVFDIYGNSIVDDPKPNQKVYDQRNPSKLITKGAKTIQLAKRAQLKDDPQAYLKYCLQFPHKEEELFYANGDGCPFNVIILETNEMRFKEAGLKGSGVRTGNFSWLNGEPFTEVVFTEDYEENSRVFIHESFLEDEFVKKHANNVKRKHFKDKTYYTPMNQDKFRVGFDPTKSHKTENKRRSMAGGSVFSMPGFWSGDTPQNTWVCDYVWLPDDPLKQYEDILMICWYFGSQVLLESNISTMFDIYSGWGCYDIMSPDEHFIMWRWEETFSNKKNMSQFEPGMPSNDVTNDMLLKNAVHHVLKYGRNMVMPRTNEAFKVYRESERGKNDLGVAAQLSCMASTKPVETMSEDKLESVTDWFRRVS